MGLYCLIFILQYFLLCKISGQYLIISCCFPLLCLITDIYDTSFPVMLHRALWFWLYGQFIIIWWTSDSPLTSLFIIKMWHVCRSDGTAYRHRATMQAVCGASGGEGGWCSRPGQGPILPAQRGGWILLLWWVCWCWFCSVALNSL